MNTGILRMPRQMRTTIAVATLSMISAVCAAQAAGNTGPGDSDAVQEAAPVERAYAYQGGGEMPMPPSDLNQSSPMQGVLLRVGPHSDVQQVSSEPQRLELRVEQGVANLNVHKPAKDTLILVDLPGGQTQILKDGLYTFNAETNTARVLKGEALAFPAGAENEKPMKVKEFNKVDFSGTAVKPQQFVPYEAQLDVLPGAVPPPPGGMAPGYGYGYAPYGDGFYAGYPYYAYGPGGYPYYGYGYYPYGVGLGFGYVGGFHGGYAGGFHGGGGFHHGR
jgi:hypothetical protein